MQSNYSYPKKEKLKKQKQIDALFKKRQSVSAFPIKAFYAFPEEPMDNYLKIGVGTSKRNFKKAVQRNRVKRLLREALRKNKSELLNTLQSAQLQMIIFFHYASNELPTLELVNNKMVYLFKKIRQVVDENIAKNN